MMRLVSLHLSNDRILWGHVLLEDTEHPEASMARIMIEHIEKEPGYELVDRNRRRLTDLTVPAAREANRIVQTLLIPGSEVAKREKAVREVIHSGYLEGFPDDMPWQVQLWLYARGEVSIDQLQAYTDKGQQIARTPGVAPTDGADVPEQWWQATQARIRRHLLDTTLTEAEAATALQISVDDVGELFGSNRLTSFDLNGEERIPNWQLVQPALPDFGDPSSLLPGLDVLFAAAPQRLLDAAAMTEFMTTARQFLSVDDVPLTPLDWMRQGRPLATVIALFRGRRWRW
ncbi:MULTISPECIES: hypothetical protein [unclassified Curtobacterium]|uniref:hypothetical protein n=1 Tax=unclassified Curtobacterium TaxID=257496 RepID=UPI000F48D0CF|nr:MULTISPECIES: hypothetical protein [unclassified Curtobacterium]ROQ04938.1 hypothetical protein EDF41_3057 [Curtobacterium sp. PhB171]ROQ22139.1 hypothetical protein EDF40_3225 [Curtobacterium sp. PhB170]ROS33499.1 hypothetical protein EDF25_2880 [Curtobacterium sp. PhB131]ROS64818.1 hypothetical protein EDF30_3232 [Curtobacterium sp. PhB141]